MTATLPNEVPPELPDSGSGPHEWYYMRTSLWHNGRTISTGLPYLHHLKRHQTVGLLLTSDGQLHVYNDGRHTKKVATNLPVNHHLWGAVDVFGDCAKIKSELLSGELDGVCMYSRTSLIRTSVNRTRWLTERAMRPHPLISKCAYARVLQ